jgi:uncharacterized membrane protein (UPF0127 family)
MANRRHIIGLVAISVLTVLVAVLAQSSVVYYISQPDPEYDRGTVITYDANGTKLAAVEVRIADTRAKRWLGLSATDELPMGDGMLFVHDDEAERTYVMRNMSFGLDIVFLDAAERVTTIHHARPPAGSPERTYTGGAKWVLEVPRGWSNETGLERGDRVAIPPTARASSSRGDPTLE